MSKYYYLIAGLPELALEDNTLNYTVRSFRDELYPDLSRKDKALIDLFYLKFDNQNLLQLLKDKEFEPKHYGIYDKEELLSLINIIKVGEEQAKGFPGYLISFVENYMNEDYAEEVLLENILTSKYYEHAQKCSNKFVRSWFQFNQTINNLLIAYAGRKYDIKYQEHILGSDEISNQIRISGARDFGLSNKLEYITTLSQIADEENLVQREKQIDQLRWNWMEEVTFFNYFTIERVFVFLLQIEMVERWLSLDKEEGNKYFREIISSLKQDVQIPEQFRKK